jgi:hypothetical protein
MPLVSCHPQHSLEVIALRMGDDGAPAAMFISSGADILAASRPGGPRQRAGAQLLGARQNDGLGEHARPG